jgi:hypothetical protein
MAGIDYNILGQIKPFQLESPMNAMTQALQLRGLQEASQMNALKAQEYQQQVQERNALARLMGSGVKYGSDEFFNRLSVEAPSYFEKIATGLEKRNASEVQRQTALLTQQQREAATEEQLRKTRIANREFGLRKIAGAPDYGQAVSMIERSVRAGEIDREEADDMLSRLNPDADMGQFRTQTLTNMLAPEKALTAGADIEKATLGVDTEKQKLEKEKLALETAQLDTRLNQFNAAFPAFNIRSEQDVENRIRAMANDKVLGPLATRFGPLEDTIARNIAEYRRNPLDYVKRMSGVSGADILKAAEEKENKEYSQYRLNELFNRRQPLTQEEYFKRKRGATAAPAAESPAAVAPAEATAVAPEEKGPLVGTAVSIETKPYGVDLLDPEAQKMLLAAAAAESPAEKEILIKAAEKIQSEFVARRRNQEFTGTFQNVDIALRDLERLKKEPKTPENEKRIEVLEGLIAAAQVPQRPPAPTEITKKEDELAALDEKIRTEKDPAEIKKLKERRKRLQADINADVFGRPSVVMQGPPPTDTTLDMLAAAYIEDKTSINSVPRSLRMSIINRASEMLGKRGLSGEDAGKNLIESRIDAKTREATVRDFKVGKAALATRSFNTAIDHLETMDKLATALQNNDTRLFNQIGNFFSKQVGASPITNFEAAKAIVGGEVAKALTGANMALKDREEIRDAIIAASSPAQLRGVLKTFKQLLAGQLNSLNIQYQTGTGRDDFATKLSPAAKRELEALNPQKPASSTSRQMSTQDKEALDWANAHPNDSRAAAIKKRLGVK